MSKEADILEQMLTEAQSTGRLNERERHDIYMSVVVAITRLKELKHPAPEPEHAAPILAKLRELAEPLDVRELSKLGLEVEDILGEWLRYCRKTYGSGSAIESAAE